MSQLSLFDRACSAPAEALTSEYETHVLDAQGAILGRFDEQTTDEQLKVYAAKGASVRVRLRVVGENETGPLLGSPLTYGECQEWDLPCQLYSCRYRLPDEVERRTRETVESEDEDGTACIVEYPGHWCALHVIEGEDGGMTLHSLGRLLDTQVDLLESEIGRATLTLEWADEGDLEDHYGERGRLHKFTFEEVDDDISATEAKDLVVPGEETCKCSVPMGNKGERCSQCGIRIKRGRQAPRVKGWRRPRKDRWAGVVRVVPEKFAARVDERLMNKLSAPEIPAHLMKPSAPPKRAA